jgi:hypothetical protein
MVFRARKVNAGLSPVSAGLSGIISLSCRAACTPPSTPFSANQHTESLSVPWDMFRQMRAIIRVSEWVS